MNLPNKLTVLRMVMIPVFVAVYFIDAIPYHYLISAGVFALAAFTDFLDGKIARKYNLVTNFGKFLDPIADKALVATALVLLITDTAYFEAALGFDVAWIFAVGVALITVREFLVSGFRQIAALKHTVLAADIFGKAKTFVTDFAIAFLLVGFDLSGMLFTVITDVGLGLYAVSVLLTVISGVNYFVKNPTVLKDEPSNK